MAFINVDRARAGLVSFGFSVKDADGFEGTQIEAEKETPMGRIWIALGARSVVIHKPNGSVKWYHGLSDGKFFAYVRQIMACAE